MERFSSLRHGYGESQPGGVGGRPLVRTKQYWLFIANGLDEWIDGLYNKHTWGLLVEGRRCGEIQEDRVRQLKYRKSSDTEIAEVHTHSKI